MTTDHIATVPLVITGFLTGTYIWTNLDIYNKYIGNTRACFGIYDVRSGKAIANFCFPVKNSDGYYHV